VLPALTLTTVVTAQCTPPSPTTGINLKKIFVSATGIEQGQRVAQGDYVTVTFTIINQSSTTLTDLAFTDVFPLPLRAGRQRLRVHSASAAAQAILWSPKHGSH
jgi:uncharacterized repeat protein (TIGR01451 family)